MENVSEKYAGSMTGAESAGATEALDGFRVIPDSLNLPRRYSFLSATTGSTLAARRAGI